MNRLMNNQIFDINEMIESCSDKSQETDLIVDKNLYSKTFSTMQRSNTFLMMYSYFEEYLYHFSSRCNIDLKSTKNGVLERFKPVFESVFGLDLSKDKDWNFICDCKKVRDCLLHANGRIDLSKNKDHLENFIQQNNTMITVETYTIVLSNEFLQKMNKTLCRFIDKIELDNL